MRRWKIATLALAIAGAFPVGFAVGQIVSAFPFQLQNNTLADATQVMANFNNLLTGINANAAKNGSNSDITALLGLTTPLAPSVGGTSTWTGGTSTGTANAQVVASVTPSTFTLAVGTQVVFVAGNDNTGVTTLNVAGSGVKSVFRLTNVGLTTLAGGEIVNGAVVTVVYTGTAYQIVGIFDKIGTVDDYIGTSTPTGWAIADGSCVSQTTYPALFALASTTWGSCGAGLFALPDLRGRGSIGKDGASRITTACAGANTLATGCGAQNQAVTVAQANLPNVNFTVTDTRTFSVTALGSGALGGPAAGAVTSAAPSSLPVTPSGGTITAASGGSGTAITVTTLPPGLIVNKIVKL